MSRGAGRVILFLGSTALLSLTFTFVLIYRLISRDPSVALDPALVGLIGGPLALGSAALGALGSILATTGAKTGDTSDLDAPPPPTPVIVENKPSEPIPTTTADTPVPLVALAKD